LFYQMNDRHSEYFSAEKQWATWTDL